MKGIGIIFGVLLASTLHFVEGVNLKITLSARGLPAKDEFSKSDPYAVVYYANDPSDDFLNLGQTGHVENVEDVDWPDVYIITYTGPISTQRMKICVLDHDSQNDDEIGSIEFTFKELINSVEMKLERTLQPDDKGTVIVTGNFV